MKPEKEPSWGDVYWAWKQKGVPPEEAAHQADEFMRRKYREKIAAIQSFAKNLKIKDARRR